jgi:general secretion pathway protein I
LEVLVALAILSLVMLVLGQTVGSAIRAYGHLNLKTRAWEVASDKMVEMQVYARWPDIGTQKEEQQQGDTNWQITTQVTKGPFSGTREVDISVTLADDSANGGALYTLSGLLGEPHKNDTGGDASTGQKSSSQNGQNQAIGAPTTEQQEGGG